MAEVKWIKITTNMFEDEKIDFIESLPEADAILVIWIKLLAQAGKNNFNGFIFLTEKIPYTEEMLAHKFRRPLSTVRLALRTLQELEMILLDDSGFLKVANWEKHQNIEGLDKIREQTRLRVAKHRDKQKMLQGNVTVTLGNETEEELEEELELDIDKELKEEEKIEKPSSSSSENIKDISINNDITKIAQLFQQNGFGTINITVKEMLITLLEDYSVEWVIEAIKVAVKSNKRSLKYVEGILQNWRNSGGIKLESDKKTITSSPKHKTRFHNFEGRTDKYSADELESVADRKRREHSEKLKKQKEGLI